MNEFDLAVSHHMSGRLHEARGIYKQLVSNNVRDGHLLQMFILLNFQQGLPLDHEVREHFSQELINLEGDRVNLVFRSPWFYKFLVEMGFSSEGSSEPTASPDPNTVGDWRHMRMLTGLEHVGTPNATWLSVGDAHGHDACRLIRLGKTALRSSSLAGGGCLEFEGVSVPRLAINAEAMDLPDSSIDYLLCKEALHHMTRPYKALYEMLRVARIAVFICEPADIIIDYDPPQGAPLTRHFSESELGGKTVEYHTADGSALISRFIDWWEEGACNYVYTLSEREIRKLALGSGIPFFAFKGFNDFYDPRFSAEPLVPQSSGFSQTLEQCSIHDNVCKTNGIPYSHLSTILFKVPPSDAEMSKLVECGFKGFHTPTRYLPQVWRGLTIT